jgi:hypothetical protein
MHCLRHSRQIVEGLQVALNGEAATTIFVLSHGQGSDRGLVQAFNTMILAYIHELSRWE